jgi:hypothetical protein
MDRAAWWRAAAEAGVIVAPAGLNYVVSGTTSWIFQVYRAELFDHRVTSTGVRFGLADPVPQVVARWHATGVSYPRLRVSPWQLFELKHLGLDRPRRDLLLSAAALLGALGVVPEYDRAGLSYLPDMVHNGLTVLEIARVDGSTPVV